MRALAIIAVLLSFAMSAGAADKPVNLKVESSTLTFKAVGNPGFIRINGEKGKIGGVAVENADTVAGTFEAQMDDFVTGLSLRDKHMKEKYLETKKYPKAVLALAPLKPDYGKEQDFTGKLTLHGVTKDIKGKVTAVKLDKGVQAKGEFGVVLEDYGIAIPSYAGVTVAKDVTISFELVAKP